MVPTSAVRRRGQDLPCRDVDRGSHADKFPADDKSRRIDAEELQPSMDAESGLHQQRVTQQHV